MRRIFRWRRRQYKANTAWLWALLGVAAALLLIRSLDGRLRPIVKELAEIEVRSTVNKIVTNTVTDALKTGEWSYSDMISVQRDETGRITALQSNVAEGNLLRGKVVSAVLEQVSALDVREFDIALGSLFDADLLSERGPSIRVRALTVGTVDAEFDSVFSTAGINQTQHQILLKVTVPVTILIAASSVKINVETSICVAETVIVGAVPDTYLELPKTP